MASNKHTFIVPIKEGTVGTYIVSAFDNRTNLSTQKEVTVNVPMYIKGTVTQTTQTPRLYINSRAVDATLDGTNWKADVTSSLPITSLYGVLYSYRSSNNMYVDSIEFHESLDASRVTSMSSMFNGCSSLTTLGLPQIGDGTKSVSTSSMFNGCSNLANITASGPIYNGVSFSSSPLTLASAKVILNALQSPYNGAQTLTFSTSTRNLVKNDSDAMSLVTAKRALGWTISI